MLSEYKVADKECYVCGKKVEDICDKCHKFFCSLHVTDINDGFNTVACDKCFNDVCKELNKYKLDNNITFV